MFNYIKSHYLKLFFALYLWLENTIAKADVVAAATSSTNLPSLGQASVDLLAPVSAFTRTLYNMCYVIGAMLLVGSFVQYRDHRHNPAQVPFSRPVMLLLLGLLMIGLPLIASLSAGSAFLKIK